MLNGQVIQFDLPDEKADEDSAFFNDLDPEKETPEQIPAQRLSFELTYDYQPQNHKAGIVLNGVELTRPGEIFALIAMPGAGKTNVMEIFPAITISASCGVPLIDSLGFEIPFIEPSSHCLFIDCERTKDDAYSSLKRIYNRLGNNPSVLDNGKFRSVSFRLFIEIAKVEERKQELVALLEAGKYSVLVIDGLIDFVVDANNLEQSIECVRWLRAIAAKYNLCVITTLHPNPGSEKPVGHLGTFLCRWSRAVLLIRKDSDGNRLITSNFEHGKLSHSNSQVAQSFAWDEALSMFTSKEVITPLGDLTNGIKKKSSSPLVRDLIKGIFLKKLTTQLAATELKRILIDEHGKSEWQAKDTLKIATEFEYIIKSGKTKDVVYSLPRNSEDLDDG